MKKLLVLAGLLFCIVSQAAAEPTGALPRSAPEAQGVSSAKVLAFVDEADRSIDALHSFMLIGFRNRIVVLFEWAVAYFTFQRGARLITGATKD